MGRRCRRCANHILLLECPGNNCGRYLPSCSLLLGLMLPFITTPLKSNIIFLGSFCFVNWKPYWYLLCFHIVERSEQLILLVLVFTVITLHWLIFLINKEYNFMIFCYIKCRASKKSIISDWPFATAICGHNLATALPYYRIETYNFYDYFATANMTV